MDVLAATKDFETWVRRHVPVVQNQLSDKHKLMAESPVQFLRGTFYRWAQLFPEVCPELNKAPAVLAVGDLPATMQTQCFRFILIKIHPFGLSS